MDSTNEDFAASEQVETTCIEPENDLNSQPTRSNKGYWVKGQSGNKSGKPGGTKNRMTVLAEKLVAADAENVIREVVAAALERDPTAMRLLFERIYPIRKGGRVAIDIPKVESLEDLRNAQSAIIAAMADACISPDEAQLASAVLEGQRKLIETIDLEKRIAALEAKEDHK